MATALTSISINPPLNQKWGKLIAMLYVISKDIRERKLIFQLLTPSPELVKIRNSNTSAPDDLAEPKVKLDTTEGFCK